MQEEIINMKFYAMLEITTNKDSAGEFADAMAAARNVFAAHGYTTRTDHILFKRPTSESLLPALTTPTTPARPSTGGRPGLAKVKPRQRRRRAKRTATKTSAKTKTTKRRPVIMMVHPVMAPPAVTPATPATPTSTEHAVEHDTTLALEVAAEAPSAGPKAETPQ